MIMFAALALATFGALAFSLYSVTGSAINRHPFHDVNGDAPGASLPDEMSDFATFEEQYLHRAPRR
jgi:hypothetical protein